MVNSEEEMNNLNSSSLCQKINGILGNLGFKKAFVVAFVVGFIVRLIPELLSYPNPIGWDTIYYAARINDGVVFNQWTDVFSTWLIYGILVTLGNVTQLDAFMLLKIVAPLLYGGTAAGIYFVASKKLNWNITKSLLASGLFVFQLAALDISWNFYRNIFGLMILLFTIPLIKKGISLKELTALSLLSLFVVWGHELAAVSLFAMVLGLTLICVLKKEQMPLKPLVAVTPSLTVFLIGILQIFPSSAVETNILTINDKVLAHPSGLFFLTDYLSVLTPVEHYASYLELFSHVFSLFFLFYLALLPLIAIGYFKDRVLGSWTFLLMIGSFSCLIVPFSALLLWNRWMLMLVFPFTFFAVEGLWKINNSAKTLSISRFVALLKFPKKIGIGFAVLSIVIGSLFMTWPLIDGKYGIIGVETTFRYVPSTMQSSSVPLQDTDGVISAFNWLNEHVTNDSVVLVHDVFNYWSRLYLDDSLCVVLFNNDLPKASEVALDNGFSVSYVVWWNQDIGWYNLNLPDEYVSVFDRGRISVFQIV